MRLKEIGFSRRQLIGLGLGPLLFVVMLLIPTPEGMSPEGQRAAAVTLLMATLWITEAIPIPATALIPIALFPLLGVMPTAKVTSSYANHLIYLFMGGFLIAMAIERWGLHKRIALQTIRLVGTTPSRVLMGFMLATAFLSCWISNTATAMLMVTIGIAVLRQLSPDQPGEDDVLPPTWFGISLMLGIAYAASIGGIATLIGTPPNAILAGVVEKQYGYSIGFAEWMLFAAPLSLVMLVITWWFLTRVAFRQTMAKEFQGGHTVISEQLAALGPMNRQEKRVLIVFGLVVTAWLFRGLLTDIPALSEITDSSVAILGALLLFVIPADLKKGEFLLDWKTAVRIPWDIIILFGGGFALASGFAASGLTEWLGGQLSLLQGANTVVLVGAVVLLVIFMTEVTSNTATASLLLPVMSGFALAAEVAPLALMASAALAASFAFMLPVATPPNAIVFASRQVTIPQMARVGIWLNLIGAVMITGFISLALPWLLDLGVQ
ncbi:SLC13 family permease [Thiohalophilus thiocyanatoxydans]|uniref:Sodium-dependent dicarboxylate transporter 2/3/5 n=1 Tax=Thiohalophilus thiocyanatoxydans TaxID=381308 RepID=A0A4R8ITF8_9GAMM|nr:DASS family sodium-coupled anion symporter [Thiohalophilus thiocyanatoxydans]TDY00533.1 sodium-dependent dicarboxylate transporter 2/3/5 [Thiohalophilus thiocyanatoxydans]